MKLNCSQSELNTALQLVSRAVSNRPTHPVLANVLLAADEVTGKLRLTGFDLSLGIQTSISASVENIGAITLPAKLFVETNEDGGRKRVFLLKGNLPNEPKIKVNPVHINSVRFPMTLIDDDKWNVISDIDGCLLYTSPSPRDGLLSRMPSSA